MIQHREPSRNGIYRTTPLERPSPFVLYCSLAHEIVLTRWTTLIADAPLSSLHFVSWRNHNCERPLLLSLESTIKSERLFFTCYTYSTKADMVFVGAPAVKILPESSVTPPILCSLQVSTLVLRYHSNPPETKTSLLLGNFINLLSRVITKAWRRIRKGILIIISDVSRRITLTLSI